MSCFWYELSLLCCSQENSQLAFFLAFFCFYQKWRIAFFWPWLTSAGISACLICQIFIVDAPPATTPKAFVCRSMNKHSSFTFWMNVKDTGTLSHSIIFACSGWLTGSGMTSVDFLKSRRLFHFSFALLKTLSAEDWTGCRRREEHYGWKQQLRPGPKSA